MQLLCAKYLIDKAFNVNAQCAAIHVKQGRLPKCTILKNDVMARVCPLDVMDRFHTILSAPLPHRRIVVQH